MSSKIVWFVFLLLVLAPSSSKSSNDHKISKQNDVIQETLEQSERLKINADKFKQKRLNKHIK